MELEIDWLKTFISEMFLQNLSFKVLAHNFLSLETFTRD